MGEATQVLSDDFFSEENVNQSKAWGRLVSLSPKHPNIDIEEDEIIMGRQSQCTIKFDDRLISGKHCRVYREVSLHSKSQIIFVQDLSQNGTYLNGNKIGKGNISVITNGSEIMLLPRRENLDPIAYIFHDLSCSKEEKNEEGGPEEIYDIRETLGTGNFACVKVAIHRESGNKYAIKVIDKKKYMKHSSKKNSLMDEVNILRSVSHPNIIGIEDVFDTEKTFYIVLELVTGGELFDRIVEVGSFQEDYARKLFIQMLDALHYLHGKGIAHRDLKPENILFANRKYETIKLSDFGLSRIIGEGSFMQTMCGTPQYLAPEVISNIEHKGYDKLVDLWALGAILFIMLSGSPPFDDSKPLPVFEQIRLGLVEFTNPIWSNISEAAKDLIKCLLKVDPSKRYDTKQTLAHPWVTGEDFSALLELRKKEELVLKLQEEELRKKKEEEERKKKEAEEEKIKLEVERRAREVAEQLKREEEERKKKEEEERLKKRKRDEADDDSPNKSKENGKKKASNGEDDRPLCKYGASCYRKNPIHLKEFRHPS